MIHSGTISGGEGYIAGSLDTEELRDLLLVYSGLLEHQDVISLVVTSTGSSSTCYASLGWLEIF